MFAVGVLAAFVTLVAALFFHRYATQPIMWKVPASDLHSYLDRLLRRGYDGSFVMIEDSENQRFVQIAKYIKSKGDIGLELGFPRSKWSEPYYPRLEGFLAHNNIAFNRRHVSTPPTTEFLEVDFGTDTATAYRIAYAILTDIFRIPSSTPLKVRFSSLSLHDELIDEKRSSPR